MKKLRLHIAAALLVAGLAGGLVGATVPQQSVSAQCSAFLTFPAWYRNLANADCTEISSPSDVGGLQSYILIIALNVVEIMLQVVAYITVFYMLYGGFQFITSAGSPDGMAKARKTLLNATIGSVIAIASVIIVNLVSGVMA